MRDHPHLLLNTADIEIWPARLLTAHGNADARALAGASRVLRRKRDGRYLAAIQPRGLLPLLPRLAREPGLDEALDLLENFETARRFDIRAAGSVPLERLEQRLGLLGLDQRYAMDTGLALVAEPVALAFAGRDRYLRPLWLSDAAARAWRSLRATAARDRIPLDAISGYRSHDYQLGIFTRKLARGLALEQILAVNAAPGYSEHHSGNALDIGAPGEPPAEESFESTPAFAWLTAYAGDFGFAMSYPRGNPHGITYEPWHWYLRRC